MSINHVHSPRDWKSKKPQKKPSPHKAKNAKKRTNLIRRHKKTLLKIGIITIISIIVGGGLFVAGVFIWVSKDLPSPDKLNERVLAESTKIFDRTGTQLLYEIHGNKKRTLIKLEDLPDYTPKAFIAIEDKEFYKHKGFSLWAIFRTAITNVLHGKSAGGSTLTQQFVKNAILTNEKSYIRKIKEVILSYQLEKKYNKQEILQLYFNEIPFGSTAYGIEAAAEQYFAKSARDLTIAESAVLAAMIKATTYYSPYGNNVDKLMIRQQIVLEEMLKENFITQQEYEQAKKEKLVFKKQLTNIKAPHFVFYVKEQLVEKFGERIVEQGGLNVITTLDWDKQQTAEKAIADNTESNLENWEATNASLVAVDTKTGEILAMVGSVDYFDDEIDGQVNIALRNRQPGSSFKPIVYLAAFIKGYLPETVVYDVDTTFVTETGKDYSPKNYDLSQPGPVSLRKALQGSLNVAAVKTIYLTGVSNVLDLAEKLGYSTLSDRSRFGLSLVLGGGEVTLLDHVFAYATIAREGVRPEPVSILKITDTKNKTWFEFKKPKTTKVVDAEHVRVLNNVLTDDNARAYVFGTGSLLTLPNRPVGAKTGTTNDYRDAWTIGYTPSIAAGVWVGNNDNSTMKRGASGYTVAAPIWNQFMKEVTKDDPVETFKTPEPKTNPKPMLGGSTGEEYKIKIDSISGKLATEFTPINLIEERIYKTTHNILHYVDKNDPLGPPPSNPESDPQYNNWEQGIIKWAEENEITINEQPPTEYDDIHLPEFQPTINFSSPAPDQLVTNPIPVTITWNTVKQFKKIDIFIDDILMQTIENQPNSGIYSTNITLDNTFVPGQHSIKAVVKDEFENTKLDYLFFNL